MKRTLLFVLAVLALALTACGGSSGGSDKAAYVAKAAQVCTDAKAAKDQAGKVTPTKTEQIAPYVDAIVAVAKDAAAKLRAIAPPAADKAALAAKLLDPLDAQVKEGEAYAGKVHAAGNDATKVLTLLANKPGAGKIDVAFLKEYGLDACVKAAEAS